VTALVAVMIGALDVTCTLPAGAATRPDTQTLRTS
jgi:hypothetical protein